MARPPLEVDSFQAYCFDDAETHLASARIDHLVLMMAGLQNFFTLIGLHKTGGMPMTVALGGAVLTTTLLVASVVNPLYRLSLLRSH